MSYLLHVEHTDLEDLTEEWETKITLLIGGTPYEPYVEYDPDDPDDIYVELYDRSAAAPYAMAAAQSHGWTGSFFDKLKDQVQGSTEPVHTLTGFYSDNFERDTFQEFGSLKEALIGVWEAEEKLEAIEEKFRASKAKAKAKA